MGGACVKVTGYGDQSHSAIAPGSRGGVSRLGLGGSCGRSVRTNPFTMVSPPV